MLTVDARKRTQDIHDYYSFDNFIGEGAFAQVFRAREKRTGEWVAIKQIYKEKCSPRQIEFLERETSIAEAVKHDNVILM